MSPESPRELTPKTRVRAETLRGLLLGLKALLEQGCVIHEVIIVPTDVGEEVRRRAVRVGRRMPKETTEKKAKPARGRPITRPRKPGETNEEKARRLARERQQRKRDRDKRAKKEKR